jgi:hypothetical protein
MAIRDGYASDDAGNCKRLRLAVTVSAIGLLAVRPSVLPNDVNHSSARSGQEAHRDDRHAEPVEAIAPP